MYVPFEKIRVYNSGQEIILDGEVVDINQPPKPILSGHAIYSYDAYTGLITIRLGNGDDSLE